MAYKVSVIIGIYNCAPTLQEALNSLYAQTFQDFEIILCDDGSKDETWKIAYKNQGQHSNITLLRNDKNMGLNFTLNRCLSVASGQYIARMDGDDISMPSRFEQEVSYLDTHPNTAIVSSAMIYFDDNGIYQNSRHVISDPKPKDFINGTPFSHPACMVRKEAYDAVGGYSVDEKLLRVEDYHLWFKLYAAGYRGHNISEPLYKFRDDRNAVARRTFRNRINEAYVRHIGFKMLGLPWYYQIYALRPLLVGLLPRPIYIYLHKRKLGR